MIEGRPQMTSKIVSSYDYIMQASGEQLLAVAKAVHQFAREPLVRNYNNAQSPWYHKEDDLRRLITRRMLRDKNIAAQIGRIVMQHVVKNK